MQKPMKTNTPIVAVTMLFRNKRNHSDIQSVSGVAIRKERKKKKMMRIELVKVCFAKKQ